MPKQRTSKKKTTKGAASRSSKILQFLTSPVNRKWVALIFVVLIGAIGTYLIAFSQAKPNNCYALKGADGKSVPLCDINQASDGLDSLLAVDAEVQTLVDQKKWFNWGVAFRAPTKPIDGAKPVHRFYYPSITAHFFVIEGSADYEKFKNDKNARDEGIKFYAWPTKGQENTVPIYRVNRKPLYFLQLYADSAAMRDHLVKKTDGTYEDGGVNFYAYPAKFSPANDLPAAAYDCSKKENFVAPQCKAERENLAKMYDCSVKENFLSDRCKTERENLAKAFDCSKLENFVSNRCVKAREAFEKAEKERIRREEAAKAAAAAAARQSSTKTSVKTLPKKSGTTKVDPNDCSIEANFFSSRCKEARDTMQFANNCRAFGGTYLGGRNCRLPNTPSNNNTSTGLRKGRCVVSWKMDKFWGAFGSSTGSKTYSNVTSIQCRKNYLSLSKKTIDGMNRKHYGYTYSWKAN